MKTLTLVLATVLVGVMVAVCIGYNPAGISATDYIVRQQAMIRTLNVSMPLLGAATILLSFLCARAERQDRARMRLFILSGVLLLAAGAITRGCNQPINAMVIAWNPQAPPANWENLRDRWWHWHLVRTVLGLGALGLLVTARFRRANPSTRLAV